MAHSDIAFLVAVVVFAVAALYSLTDRAVYAALIAAGLATVALGLLLS